MKTNTNIGLAGILFVEEVEELTRHSKEELAYLAKLGILRPLAYPLPSNARRVYARVVVDHYLNQIDLMEKGRRACLRYWKAKNASRTGELSQPQKSTT